jgi:hypothetical protein
MSLPSYVSVTPYGKSDWIWEYDTNDPRALQRLNGTDRLASCWYATGSYTINFDFHDEATHQLSLYCLDWDQGGRAQKVEILDAATGQVLHSHELTDFSGGIYLTYNITGSVRVRLTQLASYNAVLSGFFLDPVSP